MKEIDIKLRECPLKHDIRVNFWLPFIQRLHKKPIAYLTLYSPPMMDIKLLHSRGILEKRGQKYVNVVGVTNDEEAFAAANSELDSRLDHLIFGDINKLLAQEKENDATVKQLKSKFPFDVINLDYTNLLHHKGEDEEVSVHILAIDEILRLQRKGNIKNFILLLTTRAEIASYDPAFLATLSRCFDRNMRHTPNFERTLSRVMKIKSQDEFVQRNKYEHFVVSLSKYILSIIKDHNYDMAQWDMKWLIRDELKPARHLLHLAFHLKEFIPPRASHQRAFGKRTNIIEYKSIRFIRTNYPTIAETSDRAKLEPIHSREIRLLNQNTFENETPLPINP